MMFEGGRTNAQEALKFAREQVFSGSDGDRDGVDNIIVFVSDGYSNEVTSGSVTIEMQQIESQNIEVFSIAIGKSPNLRELNEIASNPDNTHVFTVTDETEVNSAVDRLLTQLCV